MRASVVGPSSRRTSTWLSTTSLRTVSPPAASPSAIADRGVARLRGPARRRRRGPSVRSTAHTSICRARCDDCGRVVHRLERIARREVARRGGERPAQVLESTDERDAAVVGDVEPLVAVGGPRVGAVQPGDEVRRASGRPAPTARTRRRRGASRRAAASQSAISSNGSNAPVFTSPAWAQTSTGPVEVGQQLGAHPTLVVGGHDRHPVAAEPDEAERLGQRRVRPLADHHLHRRGPEQAVGLGVPARAGRAARRGRPRGTTRWRRSRR